MGGDDLVRAQDKEVVQVDVGDAWAGSIPHDIPMFDGG